jgi:uroporphyrinogen-III synthase
MAAIPPRLRARVLVTRPRDDADTLAAALAARGVAALIEPLLDIAFHDAALDLAGAQAVLCTSRNGVRALARVSVERSLPLLAVGEATAALARASGFAAVESAGGAVDDLARLAAARLHPERGRLVHVSGAAAAGDLAGALRDRGFTVERRILYEARPAAALSPATMQALRDGDVDVALFFSPRTAGTFAALATAAQVAGCCAGIAALAISPATAAALGGLPWRIRRSAARPDRPSLLAMLDSVIDANSARKPQS